MSHLPLILAFASAAMIPMQPPAQPVSSNWTFSGSVQGVMWDEECKFTVDASKKIVGTCNVVGVDYPVTGTLDGATLSFTHASEYEGSPLTLIFKGKIASDGTAAGDVDVTPNGVSGTFTGKPKTAAAK